MIFRKKRWIIKKTTCELLSVTDNADVFFDFLGAVRHGLLLVMLISILFYTKRAMIGSLHCSYKKKRYLKK